MKGNITTTIKMLFASATASLCLCLLAGSINQLQAQCWSQKANLPAAPRYAAAGFGIGSTVYMGTGDNKNDFWAFNPATNVWTQVANFGGTGRTFATAFSIGNKGYLGLGDDPGGYRNDFWEYNPATNAWLQKASLPASGRQNAFGFAIGSLGYVGTGLVNNSPLFSDFWEYNPSTNLWTQKADFGGGQREWAVGFSIGTKGYAGTGFANGAYHNDFWEYDPLTNTWAQRANISENPRSCAAGFSVGTKGYIGTGEAPNYSNDFWEYNSLTDEWIQKADYGSGASIAVTGLSAGGKGYFGLGNTSFSVQPDLWEFDPASGNSSMVLTSPAGTNHQTICVNHPAIPITYSIIGATAVTVTGLPAGVTFNWSSNVLTISGTPTTGGYYSFTVTASGPCFTITARGNLIVNGDPATFKWNSKTVTGLCGSTAVVYSITNGYGVSYLWKVSGGGTIIKGQGTSKIKVNFPSANFVDTILVTASNACSAITLATSVKSVPAKPASITGPATACAHQTNVAYSAAAVASATSYTWLVPAGAVITSGQGTQSIVMTYGTSGGNVKVKASNSCGSGSFKTLSVSINCKQGVPAEAMDAGISIYPNPSQSYFTLQFDSPDNGSYNLVVRDITGRVIGQWDNLNSNENFDFGNSISNGVYIAEVMKGGSKKLLKLIKSD